MSKLFALVVVAGLASSASAVIVTATPIDAEPTFAERNTPVFQSLGGGYAGFAAASGTIGFDDYASIEAGPTFLLSQLVFVGGVTSVNQTLTFNFYNTSNSLVNTANVTFGTAGNFIWTITFGTLPDGSDSTFAVPNAGVLEIVATAPSSGRWFLNGVGTVPTIGSESNTFGAGTGLNRSQAFQLNAVPTPGAAALLGLGGLLAARRRR